MENNTKYQAENVKLKEKIRDMEYYKRKYEVRYQVFIFKMFKNFVDFLR